MQRKKTYNRFRYYPLLQTRLEKKLTDGGAFEYYLNKTGYPYLPSTKDLLSSFEKSMLEAQRIEADYKVKSRYGDGLVDEGDRLLYIEQGLGNLRAEHILRISSFADPDGRKEYLNIKAKSGAYAGQAPVQPAKNNRLITRFLFKDFTEIQTFISTPKLFGYIFGQMFKGSPDVPLKGIKNPFYLNNKESTPAYPALISVHSLENLKILVGDLSHNLSKWTSLRGGLNLYLPFPEGLSAPQNALTVPANSEVFWHLEFS